MPHVAVLRGFWCETTRHGGKVLWVATLITSLQLGHSPVMLIWARVAERCWPHLGHANLMSGFCAETRGPGGKVLWIGTVITSLQLGHGAVMLIWARVAERCWPHLGHANLMSAGS
jgi:hypothetical protein